MLSVLPPILVGMPHLAYGGLSENWLFKECGHRHWLQLAQRLGQRNPDFRDRDGNRLYAAFTALRADCAGLADIHEHDLIDIRSSLERISRTQFSSRHWIERSGRPLVTVELLSVFVRRAVAGCNRTTHRYAVAERNEPNSLNGLFEEPSDLAQTARAIRSDSRWIHREFVKRDRRPSKHFNFKPCPWNDFNGADFLYFANFSAIVDRADWAWRNDALSRPVARELFFHGNVDLGDSVTVVLCASRRSGRRYDHWCEILRDADGQKIADVFTSSADFAGLDAVDKAGALSANHPNVFCRPASLTID